METVQSALSVFTWERDMLYHPDLQHLIPFLFYSFAVLEESFVRHKRENKDNFYIILRSGSKLMIDKIHPQFHSIVLEIKDHCENGLILHNLTVFENEYDDDSQSELYNVDIQFIVHTLYRFTMFKLINSHLEGLFIKTINQVEQEVKERNMGRGLFDIEVELPRPECNDEFPFGEAPLYLQVMVNSAGNIYPIFIDKRLKAIISEMVRYGYLRKQGYNNFLKAIISCECNNHCLMNYDLNNFYGDDAELKSIVSTALTFNNKNSDKI
jgi:hypothetical protein